MTAQLRERPAWGALERHFAAVRDLHLRDLFAADPERGERLAAEGAGIYLDYSKNRVTDETLRLLLELARESGLEERTEAMFRGDRINTTENRSVLHVALRVPRGTSLDGRDVVADVHEVLDRMASFADRIRSGAWTGSYRQADPQRRQHRDRRIRPRPRDGLRGAAPLRPARHDLPVRLERRLDRLRRGDARPRSRGDAVHRLVEDVHDARDDDQRAHRARLGARGARRRGSDREALRRGVDQRRRGREVRHRHRQHVRLLGLGRRALLDGLRDRPLDDARDRPRPLP